jgi:putative ABC transport system permease protein
MWKVTRKGLMAHKLRFLLTGIAVVLGVAFVSGTFVFTATIQSTFDDLFTNIYKGTDAQVRGAQVLKGNDNGPGGGDRPTIPETLQPVVAGAPGVAGAQGNVQINYAQVVKANGKAIGTPGQGAPTLGFGWNPNERLNQFHLVPPGRAPENDDEIVIDRGTAKDGKFQLGDEVTVLTSKAPQKYKLVGTAKFGTSDNLAGASVVLFTLPQAQKIAGKVGRFDYINIAAKPGVSQKQVAANVRTVLPPNQDLEVVTGQKLIQENQDQIKRVLGFLNTGLLVFGFVALAVGGFIIYNTFSIIIAQRSREMALLRAIGASRGQVLGSILGESLAVGVIASIIGIGMGVVLAIGLRALVAVLTGGLPGSGAVVPFNAIVYGLLVGIGITLLSALLPALNASRVPPVAAMRDVSIERPIARGVRFAIGGGLTVLGIAGLLGGLFGPLSFWFIIIGAVAIFAGVFVMGPLYARAVALVIGAPVAKTRGITGEIARENVGRSPRRTATTASALMIGVALIAFIAIFAGSLKTSFAGAIDSQIKSDYVINSGGAFGGTGLSPALGEQLIKLPELSEVARFRIGQVAVNGSREFIGATDPKAAEALFDLNMVDGSLGALTDNGIVISKKYADNHHLKVGDHVPVTFVKTGSKPMTIQGIYGVQQIALPGNFIISIGAYEQNFDEQLDALIYAKLAPGVTAEQGRAAIEPLLAQYPTAKLQDNTQYKQDQLKNLNALVNLVYGLLFFAVIIAFIGVVNTLALSIYERTHELGLLRAVGMSRRQVRSSIRWEAVLISLLGTLLGIVIGFFFGWACVHALADQGLNKFDPAVGTLIVLVIAAAILGVVSAIFPARRAAKLDVLRAVASE